MMTVDNREQREKWVNSVLYMLDLEPIENDLVGSLQYLAKYDLIVSSYFD